MVKLHECRISRRGKGAKGTVVVKTLGLPILNEDGIAKGWSYDHLADKNIDDILSATQGIANKNIALAMGLDVFLKSEHAQAQSHVAILASRIFAANLAMDNAEATKVAQAMYTVRYNLKSLGTPEDEIEMVASLDILMARREKVVSELKKNGLWTVKTTLVETPKPEIIQEDDSEEDSE
jgi:hypothetical protein